MKTSPLRGAPSERFLGQAWEVREAAVWWPKNDGDRSHFDDGHMETEATTFHSLDVYTHEFVNGHSG